MKEGFTDHKYSTSPLMHGLPVTATKQDVYSAIASREALALARGRRGLPAATRSRILETCDGILATSDKMLETCDKIAASCDRILVTINARNKQR